MKAAYTGIQKSVRVETKSSIAIDDILVLDESDSSRSRNVTDEARQLRRIARLASLDPGDGLSL